MPHTRSASAQASSRTDCQADCRVDGQTYSQSTLLAILLACIALLSGALGYFINQQQSEQIAAQLQLNELRGRLFEEQISRTFGQAESSLHSLADILGDGGKARELSGQLSRSLRLSPHLRSLSILDPGGIIVASSAAANLGKRPNISGLAPSGEPPTGGLRIGLSWRGHDLGDGQPLLPGMKLAPNGSSFIAVSITTGQHYTLIAALDSDYLIKQIQSTLPPNAGKAELLRDDNRLLLTSTPDSQDELSQVHVENDLPNTHQPAAAGSSENADYHGRAVLSAYRNAAQYPLTVIVHADRATALAKWRADTRHTLAVALPLLLLLAAGALRLFLVLRRRNGERATMHAREQQRMSAVLDSLPASIMMLDHHGRISLSNAGWNKDMDQTCPELPKERLGMHYTELLHHLNEHGWYERQSLPADIAALLSGAQSRLDQEIFFKNGPQPRWFRLLGQHLGDGDWPGAIIMRVDITEQKKNTEQLRLASRIFASTTEGLLITDADTHIVWVNQAFEKITGYREPEVLGRTPALLNSGLQEASFYEQMYDSLGKSGSWQGEIINRRKDGTVYPEWLTISALVDDGGQVTHYVAIFSDITERKASEERIRYLSEHDFLTKLPNRMLFEDRLRQAIKHAQRQTQQFAILFIDLDRFKAINDTFGHPVGDRLLQEVALRLQAAVRGSDTICRQGGDEFLILLHDIKGADDAARIAEKIIQQVGQPYFIDKHQLNSSPSIGIALYPDDGDSSEALISNADTAMYVSKEGGRNIYHFFRPDMNERTQARLSIEDGLHRALANGELELYYQPQVAVGDGRIVGIEALLRWHDPGYGTRMPATFIPIAEESGLIVAIGDWVLRQACRQARLWRQAGLYQLPLSVNVAARQFASPDFGAKVQAALAAEGLGPDAIELEVTESMLLDITDERLATITALKEMGLKLSIDDFGTGYSSLSYLHKLPVDKLKIDRSFIHQLHHHTDNAKITEAIIHLAHSLGLNILAEGVETLAQLDYLNALGCDGYQGFFFSKPIPVGEIECLLQELHNKT